MRGDPVARAVLIIVLVAGAASGVLVAGGFSDRSEELVLPAISPVAPTTPGSTTTTSVTPSAPLNRVTIIGDSYTSGSDMGGVDRANWTERMRRLLINQFRIRVNVLGAGGSGYVATGATDRTFLDLVNETVTGDEDLVVVFGSRNDDDASLDQVRSAVEATLTRIAELAPNAELLVVGPPWVNESVPDEIGDIRDVLAELTARHGGSFLDPIADGWFFGADSALIGTDGVHPTDDGHQYMAEKIAPVIAGLLPVDKRIPQP